MKNMFLSIIERVKVEGDLIAIRTDREETFRFATGYVEDFDETMIYLKSIDPEGNDDGYVFFKMDDIYQIDYKNRYLKRLKLLITNKNVLDELQEVKVESGKEKFIIKLLKIGMQDNQIATINLYDFSITGYITEVDNSHCKIKQITEDGDDDGVTIIRIEDIERVYIGGRDQKKISLFYKNRDLR